LAQPFLGTERTVIPYSDFDQNLNAIHKAHQDRIARYRHVMNNIELVFLSFLLLLISRKMVQICLSLYPFVAYVSLGTILIQAWQYFFSILSYSIFFIG